MANNGGDIDWGLTGGSVTSGNVNVSSVSWPDPKPEFRKSTNEIEDKVWYEMDVSQADTIVILQDGKRVEMDKKDFLQRIGLEW